MDKYIHKSKEIIEENIYCTIATASLDGKPWISPVFFAYDEKYEIYWVSNKDALHSKNLRENPLAAIVVFDSNAPEGDGDGVYFECKVKELTEGNELAGAIEILNNRVSQEDFKVKSYDQVTFGGIWRIYKAIPINISTLTEGEFINDQYVDKRVEVNLL